MRLVERRCAAGIRWASVSVRSFTQFHSLVIDVLKFRVLDLFKDIFLSTILYDSFCDSSYYDSLVFTTTTDVVVRRKHIERERLEEGCSYCEDEGEEMGIHRRASCPVLL